MTMMKCEDMCRGALRQLMERMSVCAVKMRRIHLISNTDPWNLAGLRGRAISSDWRAALGHSGRACLENPGEKRVHVRLGVSRERKGEALSPRSPSSRSQERQKQRRFLAHRRVWTARRV